MFDRGHVHEVSMAEFKADAYFNENYHEIFIKKKTKIWL